MEEIVNKIKEAKDLVTEKIVKMKNEVWGDEQKMIVDEFKDKGVDRVKEIMADFNNSGDLFQSAGFKQERISISLGLPPDITSEFYMINKISKEEQNKLIEQVKDNKILQLVLSCLFKANNFCDKIELGSYKLEYVEITLGLIPGIAIYLNK